MSNIGIFYGSDTGNTKKVAEHIASLLNTECLDVADCSADQLEEYDILIMGTPTVAQGEIQPDWDYFIPEIEDADLSGKKVALFGLGDQQEYADTFVDAMGELADQVEESGAELIGQWPTEGYDFSESEAVRGDHFCRAGSGYRKPVFPDQ